MLIDYADFGTPAASSTQSRLSSGPSSTPALPMLGEWPGAQRISEHFDLEAHLDVSDLHQIAAVGDGRLASRKQSSVWAILDSNQGPPPYQRGALTD
jgi:hypothetical protein